MTFFIGPLIAFAATLLLVMLLRPAATRVGLVDIPNERSSHQQPTPLIGGLAIFIAIMLAAGIPVVLGIVQLNQKALSFFAGGLLLIVVGVIDDRYELGPMPRFAAQIGASLIMIFGAGVCLNDLGAMTPSVWTD